MNQVHGIVLGLCGGADCDLARPDELRRESKGLVYIFHKIVKEHLADPCKHFSSSFILQFMPELHKK